MSNTATPGIRGLNRAWKVQPSGNLKRVFGGGIEIIFRKRDDLYEVHVFQKGESSELYKHLFATKLSGPRMIYWRSDSDGCSPSRIDLRAAMRFVDRQLDIIVSKLSEISV